MDLSLPTEIEQLRRATREVVLELLPHEQEWVDRGEVPGLVRDTLRELGYYGLTISQQYGGLGLGCLATVVVLEELGWLPMAFFADVRGSNGIGTRALVRYGSDAQKEKWLPRIAQGNVVTAFALTEPVAGSDVASIRTVAELHGDKYVLNGSKHFITNGALAQLVTVVAYTDPTKGPHKGMSCFLVEPTFRGFSVGRIQKSMAGSPDLQAELVFRDCEVPVANRIGAEGEGFRYAMETLTEGRLHISAVALGIAQHAFERARDYAKTRVAFGKPIAEFQVVQHMLADMAVEIRAGRLMLWEAAWRLDQGKVAAAEAAAAKVFSTEVACRVVDKALQIHGGAGYMREVPVERMYREVRLLRIVEGTSEILRNVIARHVLEEVS